MDSHKFLTEFGHIANAPNGVVRLKELVLQLAIQGRLASVTSFDDSAEELLSEVRAIKSNLIAEKKLPRDKPFRELSRGDIPVESPKHWQWARFSEVWQLLSGRDLKPSEYNGSGHGIPYITGASNIEKGAININRWTPNPVVVSSHGDLLITCKGTIGKTAFNDIGEIHIARQIMAVRNFSRKMNTGFLKIWLDSFASQLVEKSKSMIPGFSRDDLGSAVFPVPPLEEQQRIVAKVGEMMALCNTLQKQQQARRKVKNNLRQSTLEAVASASSPHELKFNWARLAENIERLFDVPEDIVTLKGLVLDLAVSGKLLSSYDRDVTTGMELLENIAEKRIEWSRIAAGQEKREAQAMLRKLRTQQFDTPELTLPEKWAWASVLQVSQAIVDCHNKTAPYVSKGIHLVRTSDIRNGQMDLASTRKISEETYDYWARRMPPKSGDIFFTREAPMGEAAIVPDGEKVCLGQRVMLIRLFPELFNNRYLLYVIQSPSFQARMAEAAIGMGVKHLRVGGVEGLAVPVPPKVEQDRIVAIVDDIFRHCDQYADQLSRKQSIASNLAASAVSNLSGIAIGKVEEKPVKAPETELLAPLRLGTTPNVKVQAPLATILARHNGEMTAKDLWQRFGGEIDGFYAQLKTEVAHGWIMEPAPAEMREKHNDTVSA